MNALLRKQQSGRDLLSITLALLLGALLLLMGRTGVAFAAGAAAALPGAAADEAATGQCVTQVSAPSLDMARGSVAWADHDGGGGSVLFVTGVDSANLLSPQLYRSGPCASSNGIDVPDGDVQALIDAIHAANSVSTQGMARQSSSGVVNLAANGVYTLTEADNADLGGNGLPVITGTVIINGNGATIARSSAPGTPEFRILRTRSGSTLTLRDLTLTNGAATSGAIDDQFGGALNSFGALTLERTRILSNTARSGGGLLLGAGPVAITDSLVAGNSAGTAGGGLQLQEGAVALTGVTAENNSAANGGGLATVVGDVPLHLTINRSTIRHNSALASANPLDGTGGGIRFTMAITNAGADTVVEINDTMISDNMAINGGGIGMGLFQPDSLHKIQVTLNRSAVVNNSALWVQNLSDGMQQGNGGGILNLNAELHLVNSTISGNMAGGNPQAYFSGLGGGIANGRTGLPTTVTMTNTTIVNNTALAGGGILNATAAGDTGPTASFANSLIAGNTAGLGSSCLNQGGAWVSLGHNLDQNDDCGFSAAGDQTDVDPLIGPLADNGGPTPTHTLLENSPAIDTADDTLCPATDQRGVTRPQGPACDIGAYEVVGDAQFYLYLPVTQR